VDTHFVLECIQNAADNQYPREAEPFLRIRARSDRIQLDCNEKGFTAADVKAICKVGGSNKTSKGGFIGAKGIGFKSVFKIAQEVHINSLPYSFRFDKGQELGMIIPIWVPEEEVLVGSNKDCQTSILLLPPAAEDFAKHLDKFKAISPTLLLFLPKLKRLEILLHEKQASGGEVETRRDLRSKTDETDKVITLTVEDSSSPYPEINNYRKFKGRWKACEGEEQREGVETSEIILAFPVDIAKRTPLRTQNVHAFLPIRDFGFTVFFLLLFLHENRLIYSICSLLFKQTLLSLPAAKTLKNQMPGIVFRELSSAIPSRTRYLNLYFCPTSHFAILG
jgi:hypothetical protein